MKKPFQWTWYNYVYSLERLADLIEEDKDDRAYFYLINKNFEEWFDSIGEIDLYKKAKKHRKKIETETDVAKRKKNKDNFITDFPTKLRQCSNNKSFIELLDINRAIDLTLKEYEVLRSEILQNTSEISQLILLGLAAIFTIASIGLAPLSDFLTEEDTIIDMPLNLEDIYQIIPNPTPTSDPIPNPIDIKIYNHSDDENSTVKKQITLKEFVEQINPQLKDQEIQDILEKNKIKGLNLDQAQVRIVGSSTEPKYFLRVTKKTNGQTIEERGIVPSIVIFNWLIPGLSFYLIYRSLFAIKKNRMIGKYIYHRVEQKLVNLSVLKKQYLRIEDDNIDFKYINPNTNQPDPNHFFTTRGNQTMNTMQGNPPQPTGRGMNEYAANFKEHLTHISWEHYISQQETKFLDPLDANLIYLVFVLISGISFAGGITLLIFNFDINEWFFYEISLNWKFWVGLFIITIGTLFIFLYQPIISKNDLENENKRQLIIIHICLSMIFAMIVLYFFIEITTGKDILKFLFLLCLPFGMYIFFLLICLKRKNEVDKLANPQNSINQKMNFRTDKFDKIVDEMWNDRNPKTSP